MSTIEQAIHAKVEAELTPTHMLIENESHMHSGPATESHFKLTCVSLAFEGLNRVKRHQKVYALLGAEFDQGLHALALHLFSPEEWALKQTVPASPTCQGGS
ncbi:BolA family protein [Agaribacterium sp. ZY112]|uniref:BolA family protein n=1 Tax=Agaribacterium sp. ZY112 TaxID=3233574 RepID=UPI003523785F